MKILLVSAIDSPHTQQWVTGLVQHGLEIGIFSLRDLRHDWVSAYPQVKVLYARHPTYFPALRWLNNINLFTYNSALREAIQSFQPDLIHAHNLGNHGLIAARAGQHPLLVSAWGSDIFTHPHKSAFHRYWTQYTLAQADRVLATSKVLAAEIKKYSSKTVDLTPFGIDCQRFKPKNPKNKFAPSTLVIGSVKGLETVYNHPLTLRAFAALVERQKNQDLHLLLAGKGSQMEPLKALAVQLGIDQQVTFTGLIPYPEVPNILEEIDIFVNVSKRESFGVAVLEASAMEIPVVATRVEGLPEVVEDGETGFLIPSDNVEALVEILEKLVLDPSLRQRLGRSGRAFVLAHYEKQQCIEKMMHIYREVISDNSNT